MSYLCDYMVSLKTPISELKPKQVQQLVKLTIDWSIKYLGSRINKNPPRFIVTNQKAIRFKNKAYGRYYSSKHLICIYKNNICNVKQLIQITLHEYCHSLQDLSSYNNLLSELGYKNHPQEQEAIYFESFYPPCWNSIKRKLKRLQMSGSMSCLPY